MYKWLPTAKGGTVWIYHDKTKGAGGIVMKNPSGEYEAGSPTRKKVEGIWMHDHWGNAETLSEAKRIVERKAR